MKSPFKQLPISLLLVQVAWVWAGVGFLFFAVSWHSLSHCVFGLASLLVVVALSLRWRAGFWFSAAGLAAGVGGTLARILAVDSPHWISVLSLLIGIAVLIVHQSSGCCCWFHFQKVRSVRLSFWLLVALVSIVSEFYLFRLLPKDL